MTNILEKSLLVAFGVFIIISFLWILAPFLNVVINFQNNQSKDLAGYTSIINQIDSGIEHVIEYPDELFSRTVEYPKALNMTFFENYAKFSYVFEGHPQINIIEYSKSFYYNSFEDIVPGSYALEISFFSPLMYVSIK